MSFIAAGVAVAAVGVGVSGYGLFESSQDRKRQQAAQQAAAAAQAQQVAIQGQIIGVQQDQNVQRQNAMVLDATRRRREMIRQSIAGRSQALTAATAAGAGGAASSAIPGANAGISGQTGVNVLGVNQNEEIGTNLFNLNTKISGLNQQYAAAGGVANQYTSQANQAGANMQFDNSLVSFGSSLMSNASNIGKIAGSVGGFFGPSATASNYSGGSGTMPTGGYGGNVPGYGYTTFSKVG